MADPRPTGTFADSVEQLPDLAPVRPTGESLEPPPAWGEWLGKGWSAETMRAGRAVGRGDRSDFDEIMVRDGYTPILEALELDGTQNPAGFNDDGAMGPHGEALLMPSELLRRQGRDFLGSMTNRATQEQLIAAEIKARRAKDPKFLAGVPDTVAGLRAYFLENEKKKRGAAQGQLEQSEGLGGLLSSLAGSAVEAFHDPLNIITLPIGGGGTKTLQIVGREMLVNGALELMQQPLVAQNRAELGEQLTAGEVVTNVTVAGLFGGVLEGTIHLGAKGVAPVVEKLSPVARRALEKIQTARIALGIRAADVPASELVAGLENREIAALTRELIGDDKLTPDERAAIAVLDRGQDEGEISPFAPGPAGNAKHDESLSGAINDILENRRTTEPLSPDAGAGEGGRAAPTPERPPATSTAARPQSPIVGGEAAIDAFKAKTRHAESGRAGVNADNPNSSADGLYQITDGTFRSYHKRLFGTDPGEHPSKAVKNDPATQEKIMDALTRDNAAKLGSIGEAVTEGNLYLLHFAGERAGARILKADPDMPIERIMSPEAIAANPFLKGKSTSEVVAWAHKKMGGSAAAVPSRGAGGELAIDGEDPKIAQLREEALRLGDQIVGLTKLADGSPINLFSRNVPASSIGVDATRFQFKGGGDEFGVTERLKGITEWDAGLAGRVTLWEDEGGKLWIADGHQRHGLARRISAQSGTEIGMDAMVLRERDGVSADEARVWAALKNIAEGTGTMVDAAKVLRDAGQGALDRLPPKSPLVRDGAALSRLSDDAFGAVYNERIPADHAAVIGHLLPDQPETHIGMVDLLIKLDPANAAQARSIVRQAIAAGFHEGEQIDLFGGSTSVASLFAEKAKILERGLARLRKMRLVHKTAATEADELEAKGSSIAREQSEKEAQANAEAISIIDRLAYRAGPVAEALTDAARQLADGGRLSDAADGFVGRIRELDLRALAAGDELDRVDVDGAGRESDSDEASPSLFEEQGDQGQPSLVELEKATERFSDPDGAAVKEQADSLEHDFKSREQLNTEFEIDRNSHHTVALAGLIDGGEGGELGGFQWRREADDDGEFIRVWKNGHEHEDIVADADFLLTRGLEQATSGKLEPQLAAEVEKIAAAAPALRDEIMRFASGMSRKGDLRAGTYALADSDKMGVGVEAGELSAAGIQQIARAVVDWRTNVFVDSGAFSTFRRNLRKGSSDSVDFDKVLAKYDAIQEAIGEHNPAEISHSDLGRVLFVMPDVVGDQAASLALLAKYKTRIRAEIDLANGGNLAVPIIPLQKGELSIAEAFEQAAEILGTREFKVGVPSNEAALSVDEFRAFLKMARPSSIHFLGAASEKTLGPKLDVLEEVSAIDPEYRPQVTADANLLRSKLYGRSDGNGESRPIAVMETLRKEDLALGSKAAKELEELRQAAPPTRRDKILAATKALEDVSPGEFRAIEPFPQDEPGYHRFRYVAADGTAVGGNYTIDGGPPPFLEGFNVGDTNNPVKLGPKEVRNLFAEIRRQHPDVERIHAFRMSGARSEAEELWIDLAGKGQGTKPEDVEVSAGEAAIEEAPALDRGAAVDPALADRNRQLIELQAAAPLRASGEVSQLGEIGLDLFDRADQGSLTFRLDETGEEKSGAEILAELDADAKAIEALRGCL